MKKRRWADYYTIRAKRENWRARSVYKLEEIDRRVNLLRSGYKVLDLGCYPGSWSQYCIKKVGLNGQVVGIDINEPMNINFQNFRFIKANIFDLNPEQLKRQIGEANVIISDLAPKTTGNSIVDVYRSLELAYRALYIALKILITKGHFLCKVFEGEGFMEFKQDVSQNFENIKLIRPKSTRKKSREIFVIGLKLKKTN